MFEKKFIITKMVLNGQEVWHVSVRPPMSDEEYDAMKYRVERVGGHWRERFGGFLFMEDPTAKLADPETWAPIVQNEYEQWKISRQFYPTPPNLAKQVCELAEIEKDSTVLEPSAGHGALLDPIEKCGGIIAVEIDPENSEILRDKGYTTYTMPFEDALDKLPQVDRVVMNPPFSGQRDIKHIMLAYNLLKPGGILVGVMAENDLYWDTTLTRQFNDFLRVKNAEVIEVPMRSFSDTSVDVVLVKIKK